MYEWNKMCCDNVILFQPAFGCAQHPKAGRNIQQVSVKCLHTNKERILNMFWVYSYKSNKWLIPYLAKNFLSSEDQKKIQNMSNSAVIHSYCCSILVCRILAKARLFPSKMSFLLIIATTLFQQVLGKMSWTSA